MKIAHFATFGPHACGQYATVKDLVLAERHVGIEAEFIDFGFERKAGSREGLVDGEICTGSLAWAVKDADIVIRHTSIPVQLCNTKMPILLALHGRPENSFRLEQYKIAPIISLLMRAARSGKYRAFFTFWQEHIHYWSSLLPGTKICYVPAPINLEEFSPIGKKHEFGAKQGNPNIIIADLWREDYTPFNLVYAAQYFKDHYCKDAKLHIYGVPIKNSCINYLAPLQKTGLIGETYGPVRNLTEIYRSSDILLTPNIIATRTIREAMASGLAIVAPHGCQYTPYIAEPRDYKAFARVIKECYDNLSSQESSRIREKAVKNFNYDIVGNAIKDLCDKVLGEERKGDVEFKESVSSCATP